MNPNIMQSTSYILTIDIGNTDTVVALCNDEVGIERNYIAYKCRISTASYKTSCELLLFFRQWCQYSEINIQAMKFAMIASVVPGAVFIWQTMLDELGISYFNLTAENWLQDNQLSLLLPIMLDNPKNIGADRIANSVAAKVKYSYPAIVIDLGTATTFDIIDNHGNYAGGVIAPGMMSAMQGLIDKTAQLPSFQFEQDISVIGKNTKQALQSGLFWGNIAMIEGMIVKICDEIAAKTTDNTYSQEEIDIIVTGGHSKQLEGYVNNADYWDLDLTIFGLYYSYKHLGC